MALGLLCGVLVALGFDEYGSVLLVPLGVAGWLLLIGTDHVGRAAAISLAFGIGFQFTLLFWMRSVAWGAWPALAGVEALFLVPLGVVTLWFRRHLRWWPVWAAAAWVSTEAWRSGWPFSGMPWGRLSYAVVDTVWAESLPWYGFTVVSALMFTTGALGCLAIEHLRAGRWQLWRNLPLVGAAAAVAGASLAPVLVSFPLEVTGTARVAVVQGDVPGVGNNLLAVHREVTESHADLTEELGEQIRDGGQRPVDLVVWPENSTAVDPFTDTRARAAIERASAAVHTPLLVGGMVDADDPEHVLNQGIVWMPGVGSTDRYTKQHPVPFGEYIPWRDFVTRTVGRLRDVPRDMLSGTRTTPLRVNDLLVADAICFDVGYDDGLHSQLSNGGQLAVVQTSNAMFIGTDQIRQQYEMTRLRAIESGRWLAVAAVNGTSAVIAPDGTAAQIEDRTRGVLVHDVELIDTVTPAVRMGPWPARLAALVTGVGLLLVARRARAQGPARRV